MIEELTVTNYALIEKVRVSFAPGFNVLTGETGAGKSILIGALGLLLGNKAEAEVIRTGAEEAQVAGVLSLEPSEEAREWLQVGCGEFEISQVRRHRRLQWRIAVGDGWWRGAVGLESVRRFRDRRHAR